MLRYSFALLCAFLVISTLDPISARKSFGFGGGRHSYPKSGGLSGGGSRHPSYPQSGGLSGSGGGHSYPKSGGLSGSGSSGAHGYPSGGLSGTSGSRYPSSGQSGGGSSYPHSNSHAYPTGRGVSGTNYQYTPPQQIKYTPVGGGPPVSYPVYHGTPPTYVYQYKDSGSKYGTLLTGLALLNLGTLAGGLYAHSQQKSEYKTQPGEVCKFGIKKSNGDHEETKIDCKLISSFIYEEEAKRQNATNNTSVVTTTVTNVTVVNTTNSQPEVSTTVEPSTNPNPLYMMLPNGTLVPVNASSETPLSPNATKTTSEVLDEAASLANGTTTSTVTVTTTTTNTTVANALDVKGKEVEVTPDMQCYVLRTTRSSNMKKTVPCGVLKSYAEKSIRTADKNAGQKERVSVVSAIVVMFSAFVLS